MIARRGFTLLEVMLAMLLSTALLAGLWTAMSLHLKAFDTGRMEVEQTQLVRALLQKIATDLRRTVPDVPTPATSGGAAPAADPLHPLTATPGGATPLPNGTSPTGVAPAPTATAPITTASSAPASTRASQQPAPMSTPLGTPAGGSATAGAPTMAGSSSVAHGAPQDLASLVGTSRQLRLRVSQPSDAPDLLDVSDGVSETQVRLPDDLTTVFYWLAQGAGEQPATTMAEMPQGDALLQHDGAWLRPPSLENSPNAALAAEGATDEDQWQIWFDRAEMPAEEQRTDPALIMATEVQGLRFRYLADGAWHDAWNSAERGGLPAAVEISLLLRKETSAVESALPITEEPTEEIRPDFRLVVLLPTTPAKAPPASTALPNPAAPTPAVQPATPPAHPLPPVTPPPKLPSRNYREGGL
ncbi:MAG: prepilin-type N-terminal cleavage/methylation domain-containing protein [Pirellulales bacterium]|nr:prepilin-type N-terminal cleavage/methylation domain-containing protein [Pirellulales bacterium]